MSLNGMLQRSSAVCTACGSRHEPKCLYVINNCRILRCPNCGVGQTRAEDFDPGAYYTADYFQGSHPDGYADYEGAEPVLRREFRRTIAFARRYRPSGQLLEIGCAYGFLLKEAEPFFEVVGVELSTEAAKRAQLAGLKVVAGAADSKTLRHLGRFDVVVMLDVIEHLEDPRSVLESCAELLDPGGIVILTTGDFSSVAARVMGRNWRLMTPPQHLWFLTPRSIQQLAVRTGFEVVEIDHPWKLVPLPLIRFQLQRLLGVKLPGNSSSKLGIPLNLFDSMRVVLRRSA
jgi:SAM-dependent methyltransferase